MRRLIEIFFKIQVQAYAESNTHFTKGGPWEFNLRDMIRWCEIYTTLNTDATSLKESAAVQATRLVYFDRLQSEQDCIEVSVLK